MLDVVVVIRNVIVQVCGLYQVLLDVVVCLVLVGGNQLCIYYRFIILCGFSVMQGVLWLLCCGLWCVVRMVLIEYISIVFMISRNSVVRLVLMQVLIMICFICVIDLVGVVIVLLVSVVWNLCVCVKKFCVGLLLKILMKLVQVVQISSYIVGIVVIYVQWLCFILNSIIVFSISVILVSIWLEMLNSGYRVWMLLNGLIILVQSRQFYSVMQLVVLMMLVVYDLVFFSVGMKLFSRFCSMKCLVWVLVFIVVRMNNVLNRIVKWYQNVIIVLLLLGIVLCRI